MRNVRVLVLAQFLAAFGQVTMVVLAGILGAALAPDPRLATLPVSASVLGVAAATIPAALAMQCFGRRPVFIAAALVAALGTLLAAAAVHAAAFWPFTLASFMIGSNLAFTAQFRFAAAESVPPQRVSRAVAGVMLGTVGAAAIAPRLVVGVRDLLGVEYVASFVLLAGVYALSALALGRLREPPLAARARAGDGRPLAEIARQPAFGVAVLASAVGYGVMSLVMTATPVSMHVVDGHPVEHTALVIQGHVLAMYLPSLVSGWLVARLGVVRMMLVGLACEAACAGVAVAGQAVGHYGAAMILLGIGWNLLFVAGTTLLTRTWRAEERFRVQAVNDFTMFGIMAAASLLAGVMVNAVGWRLLNLLALAPLLLAGLVIVGYARVGRTRVQPAAP